MKVEIPFREFLKIYIGKEFPDEFANAKDARGLKGANAKAKANAAQAIKELIQIAENKSEFSDYGDRHGNRAKNGWYRYDVRETMRKSL